jgi:probable rRNA maturation factor
VRRLQSDIQCLSVPGLRVPRKDVLSLCQKLMKIFAKNKRLKDSRPAIPGGPWLTVVFLKAAQARKINKQFRKRDYATDVLSFSPEAKGLGLGELILCEPVLRRQAKEHGLSFKKEVDYLIIHGFLHLLGYDHERSRKEEVKMMNLQDRLFEKLSK